MTLTHGSLFSGIGGFDEGFRAAGVHTVFCVPSCLRRDGAVTALLLAGMFRDRIDGKRGRLLLR